MFVVTGQNIEIITNRIATSLTCIVKNEVNITKRVKI